MESNDLIRRSDLNDKLDELCVNDAIYDSLQAIPTVDAVPGVRCGKCKFLKNGKCPVHQVKIVDDDFCSFGERKDDEK